MNGIARTPDGHLITVSNCQHQSRAHWPFATGHLPGSQRSVASSTRGQTSRSGVRGPLDDICLGQRVSCASCLPHRRADPPGCSTHQTDCPVPPYVTHRGPDQQAQVLSCGGLLNVGSSRRPGNKDASREENSVAGGGRYVGDGPCDWCIPWAAWPIAAQHGKAKGESALWHVHAACGVAGRHEVLSNFVSRSALKDAELHARGQVCVLEQRQAVTIAIREQAGQVDLATFEHVDDRGIIAAIHEEHELALRRLPPQDPARLAVSLYSRGSEPGQGQSVVVPVR